MRRTLIVGSFLVVVGCRSSSQTAPSAQQDTPAKGTQVASQQQVRVTEDTLQRYIPFEKEHRQALANYVVKSKGRITDIGAASDLEQTTEALRQKWKLSADEEHAADGLFGNIATNRMMWERMGGKQVLAQVEKQQADFAKQVATAPANATPAQREYFKQIQEMQQGVAAQLPKNIQDAKRQRDLSDAREKYGDSVVDYALKNGGSVLTPISDVIAAAAASAGLGK